MTDAYLQNIFQRSLTQPTSKYSHSPSTSTSSNQSHFEQYCQQKLFKDLKYNNHDGAELHNLLLSNNQ